jgi:hypothetical protein
MHALEHAVLSSCRVFLCWPCDGTDLASLRPGEGLVGCLLPRVSIRQHGTVLTAVRQEFLGLSWSLLLVLVLNAGQHRFEPMVNKLDNRSKHCSLLAMNCTLHALSCAVLCR